MNRILKGNVINNGKWLSEENTVNDIIKLKEK